MTASARDFLMLSEKREMSLPVVIEIQSRAHRLPGIRRVAVLAGNAQVAMGTSCALRLLRRMCGRRRANDQHYEE
jgi:hypothetical protein